MKKRTGWVSNSSSSSFICDACGHDVSGWDMSLSEAEMVQCSKGHTFCDSELVHPIISKTGLVSYAKEQLNYYQKIAKEHKTDESEHYSVGYVRSYTDLLEEIESAEEFDAEEFYEEHEGSFEEIRYGVGSDLCPICSLSVITDNILIKFLLNQYNLNREAVEKTIRSSAENLEELERLWA